jgi:hypothetical protein
VQDDRAERGERDVLVKPDNDPLETGPVDRPSRHGESHQHRQRDEDQRHDTGGAADQPPQVVQRI